MRLKRILANFLYGWALFYTEGTAMVSPMGTSYAANITSDATGIGNWSLQQFKTALTRGKSKGIETNRDLLPPMPWENYKVVKVHQKKNYHRAKTAKHRQAAARKPLSTQFFPK